MLNDTQRRRLADKSDTSNKVQTSKSDLDDSKTKLKMPTWISFSTSNIKKILVLLVIVYLVFKVYQLLTYHPQPEVIPPNQYEEIARWRYEHNAQGIDEDGLEDLLNKINKGKHVDETSSKFKENKKIIELPKLQKLYISKGSLTFKKKQFYLDNKPFQIFSGAMHYFRVFPEYWEDRMNKMIAGGLNTLET